MKFNFNFAGGISWDTTNNHLLDFFREFGVVRHVAIKYDHEGKSRGFAFVTFKDADTVEAVLAAGDLIIQGKTVEAKRARVSPKWMPQTELSSNRPDVRLGSLGTCGQVDEKKNPAECSENVQFQSANICDPGFPGEMEKLENELMEFVKKPFEDGYVSDVSVD
jgi:RNA recognition motif-containing protein